MLKLLSKIRNINFKKHKNIIAIILIFILICSNIFLINDKYNKDITLKNNIGIEKIQNVTKIETEIQTYKKPIIKSDKESSDRKNINNTCTKNLEILEDSDLNVKIYPFDIIQGDDNIIRFPETIYGEADLSYLKWNLDININPQIKYKKGLFDARIMVASYSYVDSNNLLNIGSNYFIQKNFKFPFGLSLPVLSDNVNLGIGISGLSLTRPVDVFGNLKLDIGGLYMYSNRPALLVGFSVKL